MIEVAIRDEAGSDHDVIRDLTKRAFAPMPFADGNEQNIIDKLRAAGALSLSLVAVIEGQVAGHVAFSPAFPADGREGW